MAPDRRESTATLNPVPNRHWSTAILDPIPATDTLTAQLNRRGKQILAPTTCMGAVVDAEEEGLVICIPISKHATTSSTTNKSSKAIYKLIPINRMEEEEEGPGPVIRSVTIRKEMFGITVASSTHGDNQGVALDSTGNQAKGDLPHSSAIGQRSHVCTDIKERTSRPRQTVYKQIGLHNSPQSTDTDVKQISSQRDAHCDKSGHTTQNSWRYCPNSDVQRSLKASHMSSTPLGKGEAQVSNWVRAVRPEMGCHASLDAEESWPPLLACRAKLKTSESPSKNTSTYTQSRTKPLSSANYGENQEYLLGNMDFQSNTYTELPHNKPELPLDEQIWPSLQKSCKHDVQHDNQDGERKRRTLQPLLSSNFHHPGAAHTMQDQRQKAQQDSTPHGGVRTTKKLNIPALLLMLDKDFIVLSPLKENLLLTLALMGKRSDVEAHESLQGQNTEGETKRQILVGQFKAFSSYIHFVLGRDASRVRSESNAGGTSTISESLSVEYFVRRFQAKDIVPEMEVEYRSFNWKKVDFICTLYGQRVGVSVTRAMSFPNPQEFSAQMAYRLLYKKLFGLVVARHGVSKRHSFSQCILHVWCETQQTAHIMQAEYDGVSQELDIADDVVMVLTVADGCHARPIFYESLLRKM